MQIEFVSCECARKTTKRRMETLRRSGGDNNDRGTERNKIMGFWLGAGEAKAVWGTEFYWYMKTEGIQIAFDTGSHSKVTGKSRFLHQTALETLRKPNLALKCARTGGKRQIPLFEGLGRTKYASKYVVNLGTDVIYFKTCWLQLEIRNSPQIAPGNSEKRRKIIKKEPGATG